MRIDRRWFVAMAIPFVPLLVMGNAYGDTKYRWDIVSLSLVGTTPNINPGGTGSARAQDGSMITVTGSGTFTIGDDDVSGGGTWKTFAPDGTYWNRVPPAGSPATANANRTLFHVLSEAEH